MIFDRGGFGLQRVRQWPEELGSLEWVSDGVGFLAAKNAKVTKAVNPKLETRNQKLTNQQAKPFAAVAQCTAKKEPGNPDKDLGTSSVAHKERRRATYAILRIWLCRKPPKFS